MAHPKSPSASYQKQFFDSLLNISHRFSLSQVFDDFLTMSIAACTQNPITGISYYEDEYLKTIEKYKDSDLRFEFPKAFSNLVMAMEERVHSSLGNDVMGDFFEQHISNGRNGQFFTPYPICHLMASITQESQSAEPHRPLRILDPACGSGRMLLASYRINGYGHEYYGIDIDRICVKMTALNLFLNGIWNSEVMCANSLMPDDFIIAYRISFFPLGIFKIEEKAKSALWHLHKFTEREKPSDKIVLNSVPFPERPKDQSSQLDLF